MEAGSSLCLLQSGNCIIPDHLISRNLCSTNAHPRMGLQDNIYVTYFRKYQIPECNTRHTSRKPSVLAGDSHKQPVSSATPLIAFSFFIATTPFTTTTLLIQARATTRQGLAAISTERLWKYTRSRDVARFSIHRMSLFRWNSRGSVV